MKIIIAPDKFKGCLSASEVVDAISEGIKSVLTDAQIDPCPMSDGGEGFVQTLVSATNGKLMTATVTGPLPDMRVEATYGMLGDDATAVIEMSAASGLHLLSPEDRNPMRTTTFGTGELILHALDAGAKQILLGIGGSATNDGGLGCAQACGLPILMADGEPVSHTDPLVAADLERVMFIKHGRGSRVDRLPITVACDVTNPLLGPAGASRTYGPQKGASPEDIEQLEIWLGALARRTNTIDIARASGAGAAGGLGWGLMAFFNARLEPGVEIILRATRVRERLAHADLCITGEGRLDNTSFKGKVIGAIIGLCREMSVPTAIIAGDVAADVSTHDQLNITSLTALAGNQNQAIQHARKWLHQAAASCVQRFSSDDNRP